METGIENRTIRPVTARCMTLESAAALAEVWMRIGGNRSIDIGAMEPTLWRGGDLDIGDFLNGLHNAAGRAGVEPEISLTTNGSLLERYAIPLFLAGVHKIRVSWHSAHPAVFRDISGGGDYNRFFRGIGLVADLGIPLTFNRVLLRGYIDDIPRQIDYIEERGLTLKLYDLYWTPDN